MEPLHTICKLLLCLLITALGCNGYSQIVFEKGYYIDNSDHRVECLIKNVDWQSNPLEFEYKLPPNEKINSTNIMLVKEFGIDNVSKYKRYIVNIDRSGTDLSKMSTERNPVFQVEELFLKVIVEGEASLFRYIDKGLERFFYTMNDSEITQLVYKLYLVNQYQKTENNHFRQQLLIELNGTDFPENDFKNLDYETNDLVRLFVRYNDLANSGYTNFREKGQDTGALWVNFLIAEKMKSNHYNRKWVNSYFWRTTTQQEVDYLEESDGRLCAWEIKWSPTGNTRIPKSFLTSYPETKIMIVTRENFTDFLRP